MSKRTEFPLRIGGYRFNVAMARRNTWRKFRITDSRSSLLAYGRTLGEAELELRYEAAEIAEVFVRNPGPVDRDGERLMRFGLRYGLPRPEGPCTCWACRG